jgi:hypothetical protein
VTIINNLEQDPGEDPHPMHNQTIQGTYAHDKAMKFLMMHI